MSEISLFRLSDGKANMLQGDASGLERPLQTLIENNLTNKLRLCFGHRNAAVKLTAGALIR